MPDVAAPTRLRTALDLYEAAERIMLQNLRRRFPQASEDEIRQKLLQWLEKREEIDTGPWTVRKRQRR